MYIPDARVHCPSMYNSLVKWLGRPQRDHLSSTLDSDASTSDSYDYRFIIYSTSIFQ